MTITKIIIILFFYKLLVVLTIIIIIIIILYDNDIKKEIRISAKEWHTVSHRSQWGKGRQYEIKWDSKQGGGGGGKECEKARRKKGKENRKAKKKSGEERKGEE